MIERALQIAERNVGINRESFDLMKNRRVGRVGRIVAMNFSWAHDAHRRLHLLHSADLHRRSMRAEQQPITLWLRFLPGDDERILRVARGMIRRKVQRLEIVVISLNLRTFLDRVPKIPEDAHNLVHRLDHGMFGAKRPANAGESNVDAFRGEFARGRSTLDASKCRLNRLFNLGFEFVDTLPNLAFIRPGRGLQPEFVQLGQNAVLARHPAIAKSFPIVLGGDSSRLLLERSQKFADGAVERRGREFS